jgi:RNA polymerase sigma factor (TIGR02999 family)
VSNQTPTPPPDFDSPAALDALADQLYPELRRLARTQLRRLRPGQTLDTTSLVHEAYVKLVGASGFASRAHFLASCARAMRHILVNAARDRVAQKRGGGEAARSLASEEIAASNSIEAEVLAVAQALQRLGDLDERLCRVVECRFYAGMTEEETATALGVSDRTVRRDWLRARAWLKSDLGLLAQAVDGANP